MIGLGNHWHRELKTFLGRVLSNDWSWAENTKFKYINIRVDTRNGSFLVYDDDQNRVDVEQVFWQYSKETPKPPKSKHYPNS